MELLNLITPPTGYPVSLATLLAQCRVDSDDAAAQTLIPGYLASATEYAEAKTKKSLVPRQYEWVIDCFPNRLAYGQPIALPVANLNARLYPYTNFEVLWTPKPPLISIDSISYLDQNGVSQTMSPSAYRVVPGLPGRVMPTVGTSWPATQTVPGAVQIAMTCGYTSGQIPAKIVQAIQLMASCDYRNREDSSKVDRSRVDALLASSCYGGYW